MSDKNRAKRAWFYDRERVRRAWRRDTTARQLRITMTMLKFQANRSSVAFDPEVFSRLIELRKKAKIELLAITPRKIGRTWATRNRSKVNAFEKDLELGECNGVQPIFTKLALADGLSKIQVASSKQLEGIRRQYHQSELDASQRALADLVKLRMDRSQYGEPSTTLEKMNALMLDHKIQQQSLVVEGWQAVLNMSTICKSADSNDVNPDKKIQSLPTELYYETTYCELTHTCRAEIGYSNSREEPGADIESKTKV